MKHFTTRTRTALEAYHNEVRHTTSGAVFLKQSLLLVPRRVSTYLILHSLAVCDWALMPTVFGLIKFSYPRFV
jgi:hypothetical protein